MQKKANICGYGMKKVQFLKKSVSSCQKQSAKPPGSNSSHRLRFVLELRGDQGLGECIYSHTTGTQDAGVLVREAYRGLQVHALAEGGHCLRIPAEVFSRPEATGHRVADRDSEKRRYEHFGAREIYDGVHEERRNFGIRLREECTPKYVDGEIQYPRFYLQPVSEYGSLHLERMGEGAFQRRHPTSRGGTQCLRRVLYVYDFLLASRGVSAHSRYLLLSVAVGSGRSLERFYFLFRQSGCKSNLMAKRSADLGSPAAGYEFLCIAENNWFSMTSQ